MKPQVKRTHLIYLKLRKSPLQVWGRTVEHKALDGSKILPLAPICDPLDDFKSQFLSTPGTLVVLRDYVHVFQSKQTFRLCHLQYSTGMGLGMAIFVSPSRKIFSPRNFRCMPVTQKYGFLVGSKNLRAETQPPWQNAVKWDCPLLQGRVGNLASG